MIRKGVQIHETFPHKKFHHPILWHRTDHHRCNRVHVLHKNDAQPSVDNLYPHAAVVVEVDDVGDCVYASDYNGEVWMFYGAEGWMIGDIAAMIIDDCGTPEVAGDKIVSVHYCGSIAVG